MTMNMRFEAAALLLALVPVACNGGGSGDGSSSADTSGSSTGNDTETGTGTDTMPGPDCGNDILEEGEECDGAELGGATCMDVNPAFTGGTLACGESCTFDASACELPPGTALVALNEVTSESVMADGGTNDALELHNLGDADADVSGWTLSDDPMALPEAIYVFPEGTTIPAGGFVVLLSIDDLTGTGDLPFGISDSTEETIVLADADGAELDSVVVDGYKARVSYCRLPDGSGAWTQCEQTFGAANQLAATACGNGVIEDVEECDTDDLAGSTCEALGLGFTGGTLVCSPKCNLDADGCTTTSDLVINELEATNDAIEIFNGGAAMADLSGFILTDDNVEADYDPLVDMAELTFSPGTTLAPGAYLVVPLGVGPGQHPFGLGLGGDTVVLYDPDAGTIVDQVTYGDGQATTSFCRQPNGPGGAWTADCTPTIGGAN